MLGSDQYTYRTDDLEAHALSYSARLKIIKNDPALQLDSQSDGFGLTIVYRQL
ncbi:MAG: hypothetical protein AAF560_05390 [Acidobacteriota bacterium]